MPATLYYYAPQFLDETLQGLTAIEPEPLSSIAKLLLSFTVKYDVYKANTDQLAWKSLQSVGDQPWAAQWISQIQQDKDVQNFTWMALYPTYCHISVRSIRHEPINLAAAQLQNWYQLVQEVFSEEHWRVALVEGCVVMLGLLRSSHSDVIKPNAFDDHPWWLQRKTELEMRLFSSTHSGCFDWGGANSVETAGSGSLDQLSLSQNTLWTHVNWSLWISKHPKWKALANYHKIAIASELSSQLIQKYPKDIWIDTSLYTPLQLSEALMIGKQCWFNHTCKRIVVITRLPPHAIEFCLPDWPFWKRWAYYVYFKATLIKQPLTYSEMMKKMGAEG
ncbi:MAG: hypothetical protein V4525_14785 [Pseudomonadota bacterium]